MLLRAPRGCCTSVTLAMPWIRTMIAATVAGRTMLAVAK
jgi:hypothetical protein